MSYLYIFFLQPLVELPLLKVELFKQSSGKWCAIFPELGNLPGSTVF